MDRGPWAVLGRTGRSIGGGLVAIGLVAGGIRVFQRLVPAPDGHPAAVHVPESPVPSPPGPAPSPAATPPASPSPDRVAKVPLTVLNNSRRTGLAAEAAAAFARAGWPIRERGNLRGETVPETTVYYGPGQEAAAALLRDEFPQIAAAAPRRPGLPGTGLTVVLTRDFQP